jgi:hypothetical protein
MCGRFASAIVIWFLYQKPFLFVTQKAVYFEPRFLYQKPFLFVTQKAVYCEPRLM